MKRTLFIISALYLTGCSVAKPLVLNNQINAPKQVLKAYDTNNTRNGANDMEIVKARSGNIPSDEPNTRIDYYIETYITPYNNPLYFVYEDDEISTREEGNYRSFNTNIFFQTKSSIRLYYFDTSTGFAIESYEHSDVMLISTAQASRNSRPFKMYKLPYDASNVIQMNTSQFYTYIYQNTLKCERNLANDIKINPYQYLCNVYQNYVINGQLYYNWSYSFDIAEYLPPLEDPLANRLGVFYYYDTETVGAMTLQRPSDINNLTYLSDYVADINNIFDAYFEINNGGILSYQYNASLSDELTAYESGYNQGINDGLDGVGTIWLRQVFRAIQAFLDFDFGFFKLGHLLGGILVIAIVIFVVRWFR